MKYDIRLTDQSIKDLSRLSSSIAKRITDKLEELRSSENPMLCAKSLVGDLQGLYRFRIGDYRAIFRKDANGILTVLFILRVQHRKDVYK